MNLYEENEAVTAEETHTIKALVEKILKEDPRCRDDDKWLLIKVYSKYARIYIPYDKLKVLPAHETITRCRRLIQNKDHKYLPSPEVAKKRKIREDIYRQIMGRGYEL